MSKTIVKQPTVVSAINAFWSDGGEFHACDISSTVISESTVVVHGRRVLNLFLSGAVPLSGNLSAIRAHLPPNWDVDCVLHSTVIDNTTHTPKTIRLTIDLARVAQHPLATEAFSIIAFTFVLFSILLTLLFRFLYVW
jgi:hypothetical protein